MTFLDSDPQPWAELSVYIWGDNRDRGSATSYDGDRHVTIADIESGSNFRLRDYEAYPVEVQDLFPAYQRRTARLLTHAAFDQFVTRMRDLTAGYGYPAHTWAAAMVLRHETCLMQAVHGPDYPNFTFEDCLGVIARFRPEYTYQHLGILIDNKISPATLFAYDRQVPYSYLAELYPHNKP